MAQVLFKIGSFSLRSYGLIVALAILLGLGVAYSLAANDKEYRNHLVDLSAICDNWRNCRCPFMAGVFLRLGILLPTSN